MSVVSAANARNIASLLGPDARWTISTVDQTGSTNADLAERARHGGLSGEVLIAECQNAGRGRFERIWQSPHGASLSTSVLLRPHRELLDWGWLSLLIGLAVEEGLSSLGGGDRIDLKWPNDVLIEGRKVCGILSEIVNTDQGPAVVCGWGINVSLRREELPIEQATSLLLEGLTTDKDAISAAVLSRLDSLFTRWDGGTDLSSEYAAGCSTIGRDVRLHRDQDETDCPPVTGRAVGIAAKGELLVDIDGEVKAFSAGDVVHLR